MPICANTFVVLFVTVVMDVSLTLKIRLGANWYMSISSVRRSKNLLMTILLNPEARANDVFSGFLKDTQKMFDVVRLGVIVHQSSKFLVLKAKKTAVPLPTGAS